MWLYSDYMFLSFCELLASQWDHNSYYRNHEEEGDVKIIYRHIQKATANVQIFILNVHPECLCIYTVRGWFQAVAPFEFTGW